MKVFREQALVRRILGGDKAAGAQLVEECYPRIYRLLRQLTGNPDHAADLAQRTFVRAWQNLSQFRGGAALSTWLHQIAYREYTHWLRGRREHTGLEAQEARFADHAAATVEAVVLQEALAQLPEEQRASFLLHYVQGLSVAEVGQVLEMPSGTVKHHLFHARRRLRALLEPTEEPESHGSATLHPQCWLPRP